MLTWPVSLFVTTRSSRPLPVVSTAWTSETPRPTGRVTAGKKLREDGRGMTGPMNRCRRRPRACRRRRCGRPGRQPSPFRSAAMICAGQEARGQRADRHEAAVAVGVERDRVVVGIDAGEHRA